MRLHLPSGVVAEIDADVARDAAKSATAPGIARDVEILERAGVLELRREGAVIDLQGLPLGDLHVVRVALVRCGAVEEEALTLPCDNCGAELRVAPSSKVELGPFIDGELDDGEIDAPFRFDVEHPIPPVRSGRTRARTVRLAPRTVGEARAAWIRDPSRPLDIVPSLVTALGIVAIGSERRASSIARALERASDEAWDEICAIWEDAHGHPRLVASARCDGCGARNDVAAPALRELGGGAGSLSPRRPSTSDGDWDADAFEALVRRHAGSAYRKLRIQNVDLIVDEGVPAVDDGGEPLLGCYTPPHVDPDLGFERPPEVRIFSRSFRAEVKADPKFDLEGEVRETVEHELEHHLYFLAGDDPMDDEEREAIVDERRRQVGRRESTRRGVRAILDDLVGFLRVGWPLLAAGALATWLAHCL